MSCLCHGFFNIISCQDMARNVLCSGHDVWASGLVMVWCWWLSLIWYNMMSWDKMRWDEMLCDVMSSEVMRWDEMGCVGMWYDGMWDSMWDILWCLMSRNVMCDVPYAIYDILWVMCGFWCVMCYVMWCVFLWCDWLIWVICVVPVIESLPVWGSQVWPDMAG